MNPVPFITAAYLIAVTAILLLVASSWRAMRRAEAAAGQGRRR